MTREVISMGSSVCGEPTFNSLRTNLVAEIPPMSVFQQPRLIATTVENPHASA